MDRPQLEEDLNPKGYSNRVLPHPADDNLDEIVFYNDQEIPVGALSLRYDEDTVYLTLTFGWDEDKGILTTFLSQVASPLRKAGFKNIVATGPKDFEKLGFEKGGENTFTAKIGSAGNLERTTKKLLASRKKKP